MLVCLLRIYVDLGRSRVTLDECVRVGDRVSMFSGDGVLMCYVRTA